MLGEADRKSDAARERAIAEADVSVLCLPDAEAAKPIVYATALLLIVVVVTLNLAAILIRNRLKKRFAVSSF